MKRCVVIGGNGFIGRSLLELLGGLDREVIAVGRSEQAGVTLPPGTRYIRGDYGNHAIRNELLQPGCEVVDLAYSTVPKTSYGDPLFDLNSNIPPGVGLLQQALNVGVSKIVVVSSGGTVYGPARYLPITEEHPTEPISPYGITKLTIDHYAIMFHRTMGLPVAVARPANAYGESQRAGSGQGFLAAAIHAIQSGQTVDIFGEHGTVRDYIHVHDVARGILAVLENGTCGQVYNIGTGIGTCHREAIQILEPLARQANLEIHCRHLPPRNFDVEANILDTSKLRDASGWSHTIDLKKGLQRMWDAFMRRQHEAHSAQSNHSK